jgi:hypothetical protein
MCAAHDGNILLNGKGTVLSYRSRNPRKAGNSITARLEDLKSARNFVDEALSEISQGKPVSVTASRTYGCSIKYAS